MDRSLKTLRGLFVLDGIGAMASAFLLGVVLVRYQHLFGIPEQVLYTLAIIPVFFMCYDLYCFLQVKKEAARFLRIIAIMNLLYCVLSIGLAINHSSEITGLGWAYIIIEVIIIIVLSLYELKLAKLHS